MAPKAKEKKTVAENIYVISGKDKFLLSSACEPLIDKLLPAEQRMMSLYQADADKAVIADVLDELRTLPFLTEKRVVLIKDADKFISENRQSLENYFDKPCPTGILILTVDSWKKNTRLAKKLPAVGTLIETSEIKPWQLPKYAADYARDRYEVTFERGASDILVELIGDDPGRICSEVDKLAIYIGDKKTITNQHIENLIGHNRMFGAFAVIDAITQGSIANAANRLRNMFASDKSAEFTVVGAFAYHFRRMFKAKALQQKGVNADAIAGQLRIWGNKDAFFRQLNKMSLRRIGSIISHLARIDYMIKTGQTTAKVAMERLIMKITV